MSKTETDDRLAEARERLRRHRAGDKTVYDHGSCMDPKGEYQLGLNQQMNDVETLADSDLAANPADSDEPLTEEWLRGEWFDCGDREYRMDIPEGYARLQHLTALPSQPWKFTAYRERPHVSINAWPETRILLRRLLSALHAGGEGK